MGLLLRQIACNGLLTYVGGRLDCVVACGVHVLAVYKSSTVACANTLNTFNNGMFRVRLALPHFFGFGSIQLALCGLWPSVGLFLTWSTLKIIISLDCLLYFWGFCCPVSGNVIVDAAFVNAAFVVDEWIRTNRFYAKCSQTQGYRSAARA